MNEFDRFILNFINEFAQKSWLLDKFFVFLTNNTLFKGGVLSTLIWWVWFNAKDSDENNRRIVILTIVSSFFAMITARFLAIILPFRFRPIHDPNFNFKLPFGMYQTLLEGWSSFPSDHAVLYVSLATGIYIVSKKLGIFALLYATFFILLPRAYVGYHYPLDLLAGAIIGVLFTISLIKYFKHSFYVDWILNFSEKKLVIFYPLLFLLTYQIAEVFDGVREIGNGLMEMCDYFIK
ncbi:MAG: phosphatase PAP2 family protein [Epsilonproteobacteria bacterium]|nr:phosphatase PAP2 family protein [Campylobacterota bacterium]